MYTIQKVKYNGITYKVCCGTYYASTTSDKVIQVLAEAQQKHTRIMVEYGDENGKGWGDIYGVTGYMGRSTGIIKVPLLVHNQRSRGGGAILDHCIVSIVTTKGKKTLYAHPNYVTGRK